ncbi:hypothetical protein GH733_016195 [Mirounga leonina]|nr:hypothetical protein GH733_016195 [Mirounga leonina]
MEIPCGRRINKNEKHEEKLVMYTNQPEDSERCESMELDNKIRDLIERNASPDLKGATAVATPSHRSSCFLKTPGKTASMAHFVQDTTRMSAAEGSTEHAETYSLTPYPSLRLFSALSERLPQVAELKTKLDAAERVLSTQEKERQQSERASERLRDRTRERLQRQEKEKESLNEELHELKKENKYLKEKNALVNKKKEHYECEIKRLNKALQDALKIECSSFPEDCLGESEMECRHVEMRTEMEVLKQQVQIYEEDFKKERSDRERLNQEKEELQQINQTSQSQLNRLNSQIKACQLEKEKLEKQLKQMLFPMCNCGSNSHLRNLHAPAGPGAAQDQQKLPPDYQWYAPDQFPPDVQHKANGETTAVLSILSCSESVFHLGLEMKTSSGAIL